MNVTTRVGKSLFAVTSILLSLSAKASFVGDTINIVGSANTSGPFNFDITTVVTADETDMVATTPTPYRINPGATSVSAFLLDNEDGIFYGVYMGNGMLSFNDLDWIGSPRIIVGVNVSHTMQDSDFDPRTDVTFTARSITVDLQSVSWAEGQGFEIDIVTQEVPIPAAAWLFLSAVGGLMSARKVNR